MHTKHSFYITCLLLLTACDSQNGFDPNAGNDQPPPIKQFATNANAIDDFSGIVKISNIPDHGVYTDLPGFQASSDLSTVTYQYSEPANPNSQQELFKTAAGADSKLSTFSALGAAGEFLTPGNQVTISDDGSTLSWIASNDPLGTNPDNSVEVFSMDISGAQLRQLTDCSTGVKNYFPTISADGSLVAFICDRDLTGKNPTLRRQVFTVTTDGNATLSQVSNFNRELTFEHVAISGDASVVAFSSATSVPTNPPSTAYDLFTANTDSTNLNQLAQSQGDINGLLLSNDGSILIYQTQGQLYSFQLSNFVVTRLTLDDWTPPAPLSNTTPRAWDLSADGSTLSYLHVDTSNNLLVFRSARTTVVNPDTDIEVNTINERRAQIPDASVLSDRFFSPRINADGSATALLSTIPLTTDDLSTLNAMQIYTIPHTPVP